MEAVIQPFAGEQRQARSEEKLRNYGGILVWTTPGRSLGLKGKTEEWLKGTEGHLKDKK